MILNISCTPVMKLLQHKLHTCYETLVSPNIWYILVSPTTYLVYTCVTNQIFSIYLCHQILNASSHLSNSSEKPEKSTARKKVRPAPSPEAQLRDIKSQQKRLRDIKSQQKRQEGYRLLPPDQELALVGVGRRARRASLLVQHLHPPLLQILKIQNMRCRDYQK